MSYATKITTSWFSLIGHSCLMVKPTRWFTHPDLAKLGGDQSLAHQAKPSVLVELADVAGFDVHVE